MRRNASRIIAFRQQGVVGYHQGRCRAGQNRRRPTRIFMSITDKITDKVGVLMGIKGTDDDNHKSGEEGEGQWSRH